MYLYTHSSNLKLMDGAIYIEVLRLGIGLNLEL